MAEKPKINCSSNGLLDTLNAKKDALAAKVGEIQAAGAAALADIKAKADEMKDSLLAALPDPPEFPNFKKELAELQGKVGKELADAKAAFKERWGKAMPDVDIDGLMEKVAAVQSLVENFEENVIDLATGLAKKAADKFDFCKDVPNVDAPKVDEKGVVEQVKVKAEEPIVAKDIPVKVEPVVPTVVKKEVQKSSSPIVSVVEEKPTETRQAIVANYDTAQYEIRKMIEARKHKMSKMLGEVDIALSHTKPFKKMIKRKEKSGFETIIDYYNSGKAKKSEQKLIIEYYDHYNDYNILKSERNYIIRLNAFLTNVTEENWDDIKNIKAMGGKRFENRASTIYIRNQEFMLRSPQERVLKEYIDIITPHKEAILTRNAYNR